MPIRRSTSGVFFANGVSTATPVRGGLADRFVLIAPGELLEEGNVPNLGRAACPPNCASTQAAGGQFLISVYATDNSTT